MYTYIISGLCGWMIGIVLNKAVPFGFSYVKSMLSSDLPRISGTWEGVYIDSDKSGQEGELREHIAIRQVGRKVWGVIFTKKKSG